MIGQQAPQSLALGQLGSTLINDTATYNGSWGILYCISAAVFTTLTSGKRQDGTTAVMKGTLDGLNLGAGQVLYGYFTTIKLASGTVVAYEV